MLTKDKIWAFWKRASLISTLFLLSQSGFSQPGGNFSITGKITDSSGAYISQATVRLFTATDSLQVLSDGKGDFYFHQMTNRIFTIEITMKGYELYRRALMVSETENTLHISPIILKPDYQELQSVIVGQIRPLSVKGDTLEYHADAYLMREGSTLEDLMKILPGITLNVDSGLMSLGQRVKKVLLDGRPFYGGDINTALQNLPYDIIDKVEIIDDYGNENQLTGIKRSEPEKVLNITIRKDKKKGIAGNLETEGGNKEQYISQLVATLFTNEKKLAVIGSANNNSSYGNDYMNFLSGSYSDKWGSAYGSLSGDNRAIISNIIEDNYFAGGSIHQEGQNNDKVNTKKQQLTAEWLGKTAENSQLRVSSSLNGQLSRETDQVTFLSSAIDSLHRKTTNSNNYNQLFTRDIYSETKLYYGQSLPASGQRFSVQGNLSYTNNLDGGNYLSLSQIKSDTQTINSNQHYKQDKSLNSWNLIAGFHYYFPAGKGGFIETSYGLTASNTHSDQTYNQPTGTDFWVKVDSLSNNYIFRTAVHDLHGGYILHTNKTDLELAVTTELGKLEGASGKTIARPYQYNNVLPNATITHKLDRKNKFSLGYTTTVLLPTLQQLQPVTDYSNPQYPVTGNPDIKPSVIQSVKTNYEYRNVKPGQISGFSIGVVYSSTADYITADIVHPHDTSTVIQHTYYQNVNGIKTWHINGRFELPGVFHGRLKISGWGYIDLNKGVSLSDYSRFFTNSTKFDQNITIAYNVQKIIETNFSLGYDNVLTRYSQDANDPVQVSYFKYRIENYHYLISDWKLGYILIQNFNSLGGGRLKTQPLYLYGILERSFLNKRQLKAGIIVANILNTNTGFNQTTTPTDIIQRRTSLLGRTWMFKFQWMFESFSKKNVLR